MTDIVVTCLVSERVFREFTFLKHSIEKYHNVEWILSVDSYVYEQYKTESNMDLHLLIDKSGIFAPEKEFSVRTEYHKICESKDNYRTLIKTRMDVLKISMDKCGYGLLLDADMVFVAPLDDEFLDMLKQGTHDIFVTHQHTDIKEERVFGKYNAGMIGITNDALVQEWKTLTYTDEHHFYSQKPLEVVVDGGGYDVYDLDRGMNVAFWNTNGVLDFEIKNDAIYLSGTKVINFHYHFDEEIAIHGYDEQEEILKIIKVFDKDTYKLIH